MSMLRKIIAVVLIIAAFYTFDWHTWNQILAPLLLLIMAAGILTEKNKELSKFFNRAGVVLAVVIIIKIIFNL
jgi:uncharacterized membrane protein